MITKLIFVILIANLCVTANTSSTKNSIKNEGLVDNTHNTAKIRNHKKTQKTQKEANSGTGENLDIMTSVTKTGLNNMIDILKYENALKGKNVSFIFDINKAEYFGYTEQKDFDMYCFNSNTNYCLNQHISFLTHCPDDENAEGAFRFIAFVNTVSHLYTQKGRLDLLKLYIMSVRKMLMRMRKLNLEE